MRKGPFANRAARDLVEDFIAVRRATLSLLRNLDEAAWMRRGIANKNEVTRAGARLHHRRARTASSQDTGREIFRGGRVDDRPMSSRALIELLRGKGAHADPVACVEDISAELAGRKVAGFPHSIAQLLFHMNYWMDYDLRRARGEKPPYPEHNSESFPATAAPASDAEWHGMARTICRTHKRNGGTCRLEPSRSRS